MPDATADPATVAEPSRHAASTAVFVDLDGTLLATDSLWECLIANLRKNPWVVFWLPIWLLRGRAQLKQRLAEGATPDFETLPYRPAVLEFVRQQRRLGHPVILATASDRRIAEGVAEQLDLFDAVLSSDGHTNLKSGRKLDSIEEYCRRHEIANFSYVGDSRADFAVWAKATQAVVAAPGGAIEREARERFSDVLVLGKRSSQLPIWVKALRPHHWSKNLLVFAPMVFGHQIFVLQTIVTGLLAFVAFCVTASAVYLLNDVMDVAADRKHATKYKRPFASGALSIPSGIFAGMALVAIAFGVCLVTLPASFSGVLFIYVASNLIYSAWLKQKVLVDVLMLASFFTLRIIAGGEATSIGVSEWLLAFSMFFFLSLAFLKRFAELLRIRTADSQIAPGRGYHVEDIEIVRVLGPASGCLAVLVLALYIHGNREQQLYARPEMLWLACPLLMFWIGRIWIWANRGIPIDDPVTFSLKDRTTWIVAFLVAAVAVLASF